MPTPALELARPSIQYVPEVEWPRSEGGHSSTIADLFFHPPIRFHGLAVNRKDGRYLTSLPVKFYGLLFERIITYVGRDIEHHPLAIICGIYYDDEIIVCIWI